MYTKNPETFVCTLTIDKVVHILYAQQDKIEKNIYSVTCLNNRHLPAIKVLKKENSWQVLENYHDGIRVSDEIISSKFQEALSYVWLVFFLRLTPYV